MNYYYLAKIQLEEITKEVVVVCFQYKKDIHSPVKGDFTIWSDEDLLASAQGDFVSCLEADSFTEELGSGRWSLVGNLTKVSGNKYKKLIRIEL